MTAQIRILQGDVLLRLKDIPKKSIHCVITSPPYWNLRDYGTATWEGGDPKCDHKGTPRGGTGEKSLVPQQHKKYKNIDNSKPFADICGKCGAKRIDAQIGLETTPEEFIEKMVRVFRGVRRALRDDGVIWINIGDSYASGGRKSNGSIEGSKQARNRASHTDRDFRAPQPANLKAKDLIGIPWMLALALRNDGWYLRSSIIWHKINAMPNSVRDRCVTNHEYVFMLSKSSRYYFDNVAIREKTGQEMTWEEYAALLGEDWQKGNDRKKTDLGKGMGGVSNKKVGGTHPDGAAKRTVWSIANEPMKDSHFAAFPQKLILPMILAGTSQKGCCAKCGAPWVRKVKRKRVASRPGDNTKVPGKNSRENIDRDARHFETGKTVGNRDPQRHVTEIRTVGWEASCDCGAGVVPCTVLDPFGGSGTTAVAALKKNRHAVLVELNPEYVKIIKKRIARALTKKGMGL